MAGLSVTCSEDVEIAEAAVEQSVIVVGEQNSPAVIEGAGVETTRISLRANAARWRS
jgi:acyl-CoA synthetase (NDP forming)